MVTSYVAPKRWVQFIMLILCYSVFRLDVLVNICCCCVRSSFFSAKL